MISSLLWHYTQLTRPFSVMSVTHKKAKYQKPSLFAFCHSFFSFVYYIFLLQRCTTNESLLAGSPEKQDEGGESEETSYYPLLLSVQLIKLWQ